MFQIIVLIGIYLTDLLCVSGAPVSENGTVCAKEDLYAVCNLVSNPNKPSQIQGKLYFMQSVTSDCMYDFLSIQIEIENIPARNQTMVLNKSKYSTQKHGIHIHQFGDMTQGCESMGGHYNPRGSTHGAPWRIDSERHVGDIGNVIRTQDGRIKTRKVDYLAKLYGNESVIGRGVVLHEGEDDLGTKVNDPESLKTGNAGSRIACCTIGISDVVDKSKFSLYG